MQLNQPAPSAWGFTQVRWSVCIAAAALAGCALPGPLPSATLNSDQTMPADFVHLTTLVPDAVQDMRYHGANNFLGRPVASYEAATCILSEPAARALQAVQAELRPKGMTLKVFDCYRPQAAVNDFVRWGRDLADQKTKSSFYPDVPKDELFQRGYIAEKSGHSRGSTVDLTTVVLDGQLAIKVLRGPLADGMDADMGTPFDWFGTQSHTDDRTLSPDVQYNRQWLRALMQRHGFRNLPEEWWHFTLQPEPYPERYFNFRVR
ncbi:MAG: M15 family metallopeptidase [Rhodoferax sp.]